MKWMSLLKISILSIVPPTIIIYIGLSHNAMMEFCENDPEVGSECIIDVGYVVSIFFTWYIFSVVIIAILIILGHFARMNLTKIFSGRKKTRR